MRRIVLAAATAVVALTGLVVVTQAGAAQVDSDLLPPGWTVGDRELAWTAPERITTGSAPVEFWSGDRLLGRARAASDLRTYRIGLPSTLDDLQVRAAGRRLDQEPADSGARALAAPPETGALPVAAVDPGAPGPFTTSVSEYELPGLTLPEFAAEVEMRAVVVAPSNAPGPRPLVLFVHGQHYTCHDGDAQTPSKATACGAQRHRPENSPAPGAGRPQESNMRFGSPVGREDHRGGGWGGDRRVRL